MTWQRVEHRRMRQARAGCIINGIVQHDWGNWSEWHYHMYRVYHHRRRNGLIETIGGNRYKQRVRICRRCRARDVERAEIDAQKKGR